jgi:hypothetical protein
MAFHQCVDICAHDATYGPQDPSKQHPNHENQEKYIFGRSYPDYGAYHRPDDHARKQTYPQPPVLWSILRRFFRIAIRRQLVVQVPLNQRFIVIRSPINQ